MTSIPVYVYVPVVLTLLGMHIGTVLYAMRRIRTLQAGLVAKKVLLGEDELVQALDRRHLLSGETLSLRAVEGGRVDIKVSHAVWLDIGVFRR